MFAVSGGLWYLVVNGHEELFRDDRSIGGDVPRPVTNKDALAGIPTPRTPGKVLLRLPQLSSYFSDTLWPDGTVMGAVQLSLRTRGPLVVAQLKMADNGGLRISAEASCVDDALAALEAALAAEPAPWEIDPYPLDKGVKKPKK